MDSAHWKKPAPPVTDLPLFADEPQTPQRLTHDPVRIESVRESHASKHRADIERGKPIAVAVASRDGKVTAETFREAAARRGVRFDSADETQRGFCWIPTMMAELCREGKLVLRTHPNGKPDKEYSKAQHNDQNVYLAGPAVARSAA